MIIRKLEWNEKKYITHLINVIKIDASLPPDPDPPPPHASVTHSFPSFLLPVLVPAAAPPPTPPPSPPAPPPPPPAAAASSALPSTPLLCHPSLATRGGKRGHSVQTKT